MKFETAKLKLGKKKTIALLMAAVLLITSITLAIVFLLPKGPSKSPINVVYDTFSDAEYKKFLTRSTTYVDKVATISTDRNLKIKLAICDDSKISAYMIRFLYLDSFAFLEEKNDYNKLAINVEERGKAYLESIKNCNEHLDMINFEGTTDYWITIDAKVFLKKFIDVVDKQTSFMNSLNDLYYNCSPDGFSSNDFAFIYSAAANEWFNIVNREIGKFDQESFDVDATRNISIRLREFISTYLEKNYINNYYNDIDLIAKTKSIKRLPSVKYSGLSLSFNYIVKNFSDEKVKEEILKALATEEDIKTVENAYAFLGGSI